MDKKQSGEKYNNKWVNDIAMMTTTGNNNNKMNKNIVDTWIELEKRSHIKKGKRKNQSHRGEEKTTKERENSLTHWKNILKKNQNKTRSLHAICTKGTKTLNERD